MVNQEYIKGNICLSFSLHHTAAKLVTQVWLNSLHVFKDAESIQHLKEMISSVSAWSIIVTKIIQIFAMLMQEMSLGKTNIHINDYNMSN